MKKIKLSMDRLIEGQVIPKGTEIEIQEMKLQESDDRLNFKPIRGWMFARQSFEDYNVERACDALETYFQDVVDPEFKRMSGSYIELLFDIPWSKMLVKEIKSIDPNFCVGEITFDDGIRYLMASYNI